LELVLYLISNQEITVSYNIIMYMIQITNKQD